jgi:hypothetical protein
MPKLKLVLLIWRVKPRNHPVVAALGPSNAEAATFEAGIYHSGCDKYCPMVAPGVALFRQVRLAINEPGR